MTRLPPFEIHRAGSVEEATALVEEHGEDAALYAGGTELLLLMKLGFASFGHLVDVKPVAGLRTIERVDGVLRIGGTVTHREIERSPLVREGWPELAEMERHVANVRVRATGTLGGNLAFADPHSDPATFLLAAGASVRLGLGAERRTLGIDQFVLGPYATALRPGELLCSVDVPLPEAGSAMAHLRFAVQERPAVTVSAWVRAEGGRVVDARLAVGSVGVQPVRVPDVGEALNGQALIGLDEGALEQVAFAAADASQPVSDANGAEDYKRALVRTLSQRALRQAATAAAARSGGAGT